MKTLLFLAKGFETMEFSVFVDVVTCGFKREVVSTFNIPVLVDKIIATICVAALSLGKSGILKDRKATTYHLRDAYRQKQLQEFGVTVVNEPIVVDHNVITSYCPETASGVAFKLLELLISKEQMEIVKGAMGF